jgi:hypothetical protein
VEIARKSSSLQESALSTVKIVKTEAHYNVATFLTAAAGRLAGWA